MSVNFIEMHSKSGAIASYASALPPARRNASNTRYNIDIVNQQRNCFGHPTSHLGFAAPLLTKTSSSQASIHTCDISPSIEIIRVRNHQRQGPLQALCHSLPSTGAEQSTQGIITVEDIKYLQQAAELSTSSEGESQPHPNAACIIVSSSGNTVGSAFLWAQGTEAPEIAATRQAGPQAQGGTAYLNLETGDCHGDDSSVRALIESGISKVVLGLRHPLPSLRGRSLAALQQAGISTVVLGEAQCAAPCQDVEHAYHKILAANEALLHRAAFRRPLGVLKYAMTLDGKIATTSGHSAWVSSKESRQRVFEMRARSDAIIVGGQTVRRDNPRLTTRKEGGHSPIRIVMSRTLDLPTKAALWDTQIAPTIVMTQRGARREFQQQLKDQGVEIVEFDFLTPDAVSQYCYDRGFLRCLWECGGTLAAPAIAGGAIHQVMAFIAPKLIGGIRAPSPVGDLGFIEMTQALQLEDVTWQPSGPDLLMQAYLPQSGGLKAVAASAVANALGSQSALPEASNSSSNGSIHGRCIEFYKAWDEYGCFSNFSAHKITLDQKEWPSVEHYYQSQKFFGVANPDAVALFDAITHADSPEKAARIGRTAQRERPNLVRPDWDTTKSNVMLEALRAKFNTHTGPRELLLSTAASNPAATLVESSPHDYYWGKGYDGSGLNTLGHLLMKVRDELLVN